MDARGAGNCPAYKSKQDEWPDFLFKYTNWLASFYDSARPIIDWVQLRTAPIKEVDCAELDVDGHTDWKEVSNAIYTTFAQIVEGEALAILKNTPSHMGLEMFRRQISRWDPSSRTTYT